MSEIAGNYEEDEPVEREPTPVEEELLVFDEPKEVKQEETEAVPAPNLLDFDLPTGQNGPEEGSSLININ